MKKSLQASSIVEAIIVLLIVVTGITGVYGLLNSSQKLVNTTGNRIEAIQIARDGLESFIGIRDTNWILYAADYENCWNSLNYDYTCIGNNSSLDTRIRGGFYSGNSNRFIVYKDPITNRFVLESSQQDISWFNYSNEDYRDLFRVGKDIDGFYTQSGAHIVEEINPIYTRSIQTDYIDTDGNGSDQSRFDDAVTITALVEWSDSSSTSPQKVEMSTTLTNWRAKQ